MTKGTAWNILASDFDVTHSYSNIAKVNMKGIRWVFTD
jgi:hypothetical protein